MRLSCIVLPIALLSGLAMATSVHGSDIDIATDLPTVAAGHEPLPRGGRNDQILWDLTHGVYLTYEPSGKYADLTAQLAGEGFDMETTDLGVNNIDLTPYEMIVIAVGSSWNSTYTGAEVTAIENFVNAGGGLLVMGDNPGCPNGNINPVSTVFGVTCGVSTGEPSDIYFTDFISHAIFDGIGTIYYRYAGAVSASPPASEAAWSPNYSDVMIGLVETSPRVVVLSDMNIFDSSYYSIADNIAFSLNLFHWLAGHGVALEQDTWGAIKSAGY